MYQSVLCKTVFNRHFSPFHFYIDRQRKVALVLNPKVGTTFARKLLTESHIKFSSASDASDNRYRYLNMARRMPLAKISDYYHFLNQPDSYRLYSIVRNPFPRVISAWRDKFFDGHTSGYARSMRNGELAKARRFARKYDLQGGREGELYPLATFIDYLSSQKHGNRNHHWDLQTKVLFWNQLPYSRAFKIETEMAETFTSVLDTSRVPESWIMEKVGRPMNASSRSEALLTQSMANQLIRIYESDFEAFGYSEHSWKQL